MAQSVPRGSIQCPLCKKVFAITASPQNTPEAALVLSLDGGGIKGYSSLLILQGLMKAVKEEEKAQDPSALEIEPKDLRPSTYFDYIVGTSTGGLIATLLGRLNLTVEECLDEYRNLGSEIFAHPRRVHAHNRLWAGSKYDYRRFETLVHGVVGRHKRPRPPEDADGTVDEDLGRGKWLYFKEDEPEKGSHHCKTVAVAVKDQGNVAVPYLFRSYIHRLCLGQKTHLNPNNDGCPLTICEVARATSAAPGYFKVLKLPNTNHVFMDGGIRANNPSLVAWNEVLQMARIDNPSITGGKAVGCFISVGTGKSQYQIFGREKQLAVSKYFNMNKAPKKMITDTGPTHKEMEKIAEEFSTPYFRFNVQEGLQSMKLDEWCEKNRTKFNEKSQQFEMERMSTIDYLKEATDAYLKSSERTSYRDPEILVQENIKASARILVEYRRAREEFRRRGVQQNGAVG